MNKKSILMVADTVNWCFDRKAQKLKNLFSEFHMDISYLSPPDKESDWVRMEKARHYDAVWLMDDRYPVPGGLEAYIRKCHAKGTRVILSLDYTIPMKSIWKNRKTFYQCDALSVNNRRALRSMKLSGLSCLYTPDSVDLSIFQCRNPFENRDFNVLFVGSRLAQKHKGLEIFRGVKEKLKGSGIHFIEVIADSYNNQRSLEEMSRIYNHCQVYTCLSKAEGGPLPLLESAACGCVPVSTAVGCARELLGFRGLIVKRSVDAVAKKILDLRSNKAMLTGHSQYVRARAARWSWQRNAPNYAKVMEQVFPGGGEEKSGRTHSVSPVRSETAGQKGRQERGSTRKRTPPYGGLQKE